MNHSPVDPGTIPARIPYVRTTDRRKEARARNPQDQALPSTGPYLHGEEIQTIESVVVERDWPEYHLVWAMLEHRMAGKPVPDFDLWRRANELQERLTAADQRIDALSSPPELTAELCWIFGLMCFQCIHYAQGLRRLGHKIPEKAEHEQAAVIHWMFGHYLKDPTNWRNNATAEMKAATPAA